MPTSVLPQPYVPFFIQALVENQENRLIENKIIPVLCFLLTKGVVVVYSMNSIGSNIRTFRLKNELTQEQLAEKLGVTFQAVSKWETNANTPDIALLPELAKALGVMIDDLFSDGNTILPVFSEQIQDDDVIRIVQMKGHRILNVSPMSRDNPPIQIQFPQNCNEKTHYFKVEVYGHILSDGSINGDVTCHGSIECPVINAAGSVLSEGNIRAHEIHAAGNVICNQLQGCYELKCNSMECTGDIQVVNLTCKQNERK